MKKLALIICLLLASAAHAQTPIVIQNPSFESAGSMTGSAPATGSWNTGAIPNWTSTGLNGSWTPASSAFTAVPDGSTVVWVEGSLTQNLGVPAQPNSSYALSAFTGNRADSTKAASANWIVTLSAGGTQLCIATGSNSAIPAGTFVKQSLTCSTPATVPAGNLTVTLSVSGNEAAFDQVGLTVQTVLPPLMRTYGVTATLLWDDSTSTAPDPVKGSIQALQQQPDGSFAQMIPNTLLDSTGTVSASLGLNMNAVNAQGYLTVQFNLIDSTGKVICNTLGNSCGSITQSFPGRLLDALTAAGPATAVIVFSKTNFSITSWHLN